MANSKIMYSIYEDLVQSASEANFGRELKEKELKRLICVLNDNDAFFGTVYNALVGAIEEVMKEKGWEEYDEMYKNTSLEEVI